MTQTTAQVLADELHSAGVRSVFGHPGGEVVDLIHAFESAGIQFVLMGHESAAALAAGTVGQATGSPGVCLATLGPGACNLVLGVGDALLDRHPVLAVSARTATSLAGWHSHQNLELNAMFAPITKASVSLHGTGTRETLRRAIDVALTPPRGPVYLSLPGDVATHPDEDRAGAGLSIEPSPPTDQHALADIQAALNRAKRPAAVVGIALDQRKDAPGVRSFLAQTGIPYADTPKTKGLVDPTADAFLGTCISASGDALIAEFLRQCDFILGLGFDPVESVHDWHLAQNYHAVTNASTDFETYRPHVQVVGDVSAVLSQLTQEYNGKPAWQASDGTRVRASVQAAITPAVSATNAGLAPYHVAHVMRDILSPETRLSVDTGSHKLMFAQAWQTGEPLTYFNSNGLSSMGMAVPGAIALALLDPARPTVGVTGDGGFGMMVQELETVNRLGLAPLFVVYCDQALSLIRIPQQLRGYEPSGVDFAEVDWATVAEGFGVRGLWARTPDELAHALTAWREEPQATVLAVQVDEALYCGNSY